MEKDNTNVALSVLSHSNLWYLATKLPTQLLLMPHTVFLLLLLLMSYIKVKMKCGN